MEVHVLLLALFLLYAAPACAFTTFGPNCTLPETTQNYISAPNVRSTLDIAWSSLATIIACTYSVLHLNVPEQRDGRDPGWKGDLKWWWKGITPSLKWTLIIILVPEYYTFTALDDYTLARGLQKKLKASSRMPPNTSWSLVHAYFINMGGYAIRMESEDRGEHRGSVIHLARNSFLGLADANPPELGNLLSDEAIRDRSKSDMLAKTVALLQIAYYCGNCLTRVINRLPTAQLEIGTLGFALCSALSYGLYYNKPRSVASVQIIAEFGLDPPRNIKKILFKDSQRRGTGTISNDPIDIVGPTDTWPLYTSALLALVFGAIHVAAWNFAFPTPADKWLWRILSIFVTVSLVFPVVLGYFLDLWREPVGFIVVIAGLSLYVIARLVIIAEMIRCLFYLPPEAFVATWATNIPHI